MKRVRCCYKTQIDRATMVTRMGSFLRRRLCFPKLRFDTFFGLVFAQAQTCMALCDWKREEKNNNKTDPFLCTIEQVIIEKTKAFPCQKYLALNETEGIKDEVINAFSTKL